MSEEQDCQIKTVKEPFGTRIFGAPYYDHHCSTHDSQWYSGERNPEKCYAIEGANVK